MLTTSPAPEVAADLDDVASKRVCVALSTPSSGKPIPGRRCRGGASLDCVTCQWTIIQKAWENGKPVADDRRPNLIEVHRALADPLRIRLYELLVGRPQSAKELAKRVGMRPDRLYHHLGQLEEAKLIEVAEYRRLSGGKVERVYGPAAVEPAGDDASPAEVALFLNAVLETTRADVNAATLAQEAGEDRKIALGRTVLRLNRRHLDELRARLEAMLLEGRHRPDDDGVWTTVLWTVIDREDRRRAGGPTQARRRRRPRPVKEKNE